MTTDTDTLIATVREALTKGAHKGGHHPRCATGMDEGCDCYARATAEPRAALDSLAARLERAERGRVKAHSKPQKKREMFTLQIQGKGIRYKVRVPGWAIAPILRYAKEAERG